MSKKISDDKVIKALECCRQSTSSSCMECSLDGLPNCVEELSENALNIIKRQKTAIEKIQKRLNEFSLEYCPMADRLDNIKGIKIETVNSFIERLRDEETTAISCDVFTKVVRVDDIYKIAKDFINEV